MRKKLSSNFLFLAFLLLFLIPVNAHSYPYTWNNLDVNSFGFTSGFTAVPFEITNATGITWTDFHLFLSWDPPEALPVTGGPNLYFSDYTAGVGTATLHSPIGGSDPYTFSLLDIADLSIPDGGVFSFTVSANKFGENLPDYFYMYGNPTIATIEEQEGGDDGGSSVPDASIMFLLGPAMVGLGVFGRKKQK